jgi:hypothetical protein
MPLAPVVRHLIDSAFAALAAPQVVAAGVTAADARAMREQLEAFATPLSPIEANAHLMIMRAQVRFFPCSFPHLFCPLFSRDRVCEYFSCS